MTRTLIPSHLRALNPALDAVTDAVHHRRSGATAKRTGEQWERTVGAALDALQAHGDIAHWTWTGPRCRPVKHAGRLLWMPVEKGPCDISGTLRDGRSLIIEVKASSGALPLRPSATKHGGLAPHQRAQLDAVAAAHACALLAVDIAGTRAVIPWTAVADLERLTRDHARRWECRAVTDGLRRAISGSLA